MNVVFITKEQFDLLDARLKELNKYLKDLTTPGKRIIDNKAFLKLMNISPRTAQIWRDEGKIGFAQEGKKIYYRMSDIEKFLESNFKKPFAYRGKK